MAWVETKLQNTGYETSYYNIIEVDIPAQNIKEVTLLQL